MPPILTFCVLCNSPTTAGALCTLCAPVMVEPRLPPASEQLLAERYDLAAIAREGLPHGAAP